MTNKNASVLEDYLQIQYGGKVFNGELHACTSPNCNCFLVQVQFHAKDKSETIFIDLFLIDRIAVLKERSSGAADFLKKFKEKIDADFWDNVQSNYYLSKDFKKYLPASFPEDLIQEKLMVSFMDVYPEAVPILLKKEGYDIIIQDQYCLNLSCPCTDSALTVVRVQDGKILHQYDGALYNYKDGTIKPAVKGKMRDKDEISSILEDFNERLGLSEIIQKRHNGMRNAYKLWKAKNAEQITTPRKIGRNEPCPCGSGKKYKKCCL
ncbi:MAG: SEC-C metal-binding domain-containing protein [Spirochaetia bacterium]